MIGETVAIRENNRITRTLKVLQRTKINGKPHYLIRDLDTLQQSEAEVKKFEATFKTTRTEIKPKHSKGADGVKQKRGQKRK